MKQFPDSDKEMLRALAERVILDRLTRGIIIGHTSSGRVMMELPEEGETEAEKTWKKIQQEYAPIRKNDD